MITFERAQRIADHLRVKAEAEASKPAGLLVLCGMSVFAAMGGTHTTLLRVLGIAGALALLPWALRHLLPKGTLLTFRLSLVWPFLNAFLLGFVVFLEASRLPKIELETLPSMRWLFPSLSLVLPVGYLLAVLPGWLRRWRMRRFVSEHVAPPWDVDALAAVKARTDEALRKAPGRDDAWAEFETVPAAPNNWRLFFKPDFQRHGIWRVAFGDEWAVVLFRDGSQAEAVKPGALKLVSEDDQPGTRKAVCLLRWNQHLSEGRIRWEDRLKIHAWNHGERIITVPTPF